MHQNKDTTSEQQAREGIYRGIARATDLVIPTLGPIGAPAAIEFPGLDPIEADDGITILKNLKFDDPLEQIGLVKVRNSSGRTSTKGKDGTATTATLTKAFTRVALDAVGSDNSKKREVRERLTAGLADTIAQLEAMKRPTTQEDVERIAATSSLDPAVSKIISDMVAEIGPDGIITVEKGSQIGYSSEVVKGAKFDGGSVSTYFLSPETEEAVLDRPYVAIIDRKVSIGTQVKKIMDDVAATAHKSIIFIADDVDGLALASLTQASKFVAVLNQAGQPVQGTYDIVAVKNPYTGSAGRDFLLDMCALTGATLISEEAGMKVSDAGLAHLGRAGKVVVSKAGKGGSTTIIDCQMTDRLKARADGIRAEIASSTSDYQRLMLEERLARIDGGMGVIRVGCYTDTEFNAKKYKFDNAIHAAQSALKEGKLPGGGSALLKVKVADPMFMEALMLPFISMATNSGVQWHRFINAASDASNAMGVNFVTKEMVDMFDAGVIDSFKVTRLALESAVSTAMSVASYSSAITIAKDEKAE